MDLDARILGVFDNLLAAFIGLGVGLLWTRTATLISLRSMKWFWASGKPTKCYVYFGERRGLLTEEGEAESLVPWADARCALDLTALLQHYYGQVSVVTAENQIDWNFPVISLGGPVFNTIAKRAVDQGWLPFNFLNAPYGKGASRSIGSRDQTEIYKPLIDASGDMLADFGYVARIKRPGTSGRFIYLISGMYGIGTYGAVRHALSPATLWKARLNRPPACFQMIVKVSVAGGQITSTETAKIVSVP